MAIEGMRLGLVEVEEGDANGYSKRVVIPEYMLLDDEERDEGEECYGYVLVPMSLLPGHVFLFARDSSGKSVGLPTADDVGDGPSRLMHFAGFVSSRKEMGLAVDLVDATDLSLQASRAKYVPCNIYKAEASTPKGKLGFFAVAVHHSRTSLSVLFFLVRDSLLKMDDPIFDSVATFHVEEANGGQDCFISGKLWSLHAMDFTFQIEDGAFATGVVKNMLGEDQFHLVGGKPLDPTTERPCIEVSKGGLKIVAHKTKMTINPGHGDGAQAFLCVYIASLEKFSQ